MSEVAEFNEALPVDEAKLAEEHFMCVGKLKRALSAGQAHFIAAGKYLHEIKEKELYKYEDAQVETTWQTFCERPDIPIPGNTSESRVRVANMLVRVYDTFKLKYPVEDAQLAEVGWTKLDILAGHVLKHPDSDIKELMESGKTLTTKDLQQSLSTGSLAEVMDCTHDSVTTYQVTKCTKCKETISKELIK